MFAPEEFGAEEWFVFAPEVFGAEEWFVFAPEVFGADAGVSGRRIPLLSRHCVSSSYLTVHF